MSTVRTCTSPCLGDRLAGLHRRLGETVGGVERVAVAVLDHRGGWARTFVHSTEGASPLEHYERRLEEVPSLARLAEAGAERVIDDLATLDAAGGEHTRRLLEAGFRSSWTRPLAADGTVYGMLFADSRSPGRFTPEIVGGLGMFAEAVDLLVGGALLTFELLRTTLRTAVALSRMRDGETAAHLERMARYARLVADRLGRRHGIDDEAAEFLHLFAPLHDVGKVAVPDRVLRKPGPLDERERDAMRRHVEAGTELVDALRRDAVVGSLPHLDMLRNVVRHHHERYDGGGYPDGLVGPEIPVEARIVTVADVLDALATERPYKPAWSLDESFTFLRAHAGRAFDPGCVEALETCRPEIEETIAGWRDDGPPEPMHDVLGTWWLQA